jgi:hypothetical protein
MRLLDILALGRRTDLCENDDIWHSDIFVIRIWFTR